MDLWSAFVKRLWPALHSKRYIYSPAEQMASWTHCNYLLFFSVVAVVRIIILRSENGPINCQYERFYHHIYNEMQNLNTMLFMSCVADDALSNRWRSTASIEIRKLSMFMFYLFVLFRLFVCFVFSVVRSFVRSTHSIFVHYCSQRTFFVCGSVHFYLIFCFFFSIAFIWSAHICVMLHICALTEWNLW